METIKQLAYGDRVRLRCSATGRYLGTFNDIKLGLFISAMDNSYNIDEVKETGNDPHPTLPVPSDDALDAAHAALRYIGVNSSGLVRRGW